MNLTNEEIRIKVAESLAWRKTPFGEPIADHPRTWRILSDLPNYPESLDACAEFEAHAHRTEPYGWLARYEDELRERCSTLQYPHYNPICATPRQRCLAYLKTKGLIP